MRDTFRNFCIIISTRAQMTYHPFIYPSIQPSSIAASKSIVTPPMGPAVGTQGNNTCVLRKALWLIHKDYTSPPVRAIGGSYLSLHLENLVGFLEEKPMKLWGPHKVSAHLLVCSQPPVTDQSGHLTIPVCYRSLASVPGEQILAMFL